MTKAIGAASLALLGQRGDMDYDAPVCTYWPEFAAAGKQDITVRTLISHQAGLPGLAGDFTLEEFIEHDGLAARLAASAPLWEPGTRIGYHGMTIVKGQFFVPVGGRWGCRAVASGIAWWWPVGLPGGLGGWG